MSERLETLISYIKGNAVPVLIDFMFGEDINGAVILPSTIDYRELNGHYEGTEYMPPKWLNEILNSNSKNILVIDNIDIITKDEQLKFCELLEHRKISTFELPENCRIIVTAKEINKDKISEGIFSLLARI